MKAPRSQKLLLSTVVSGLTGFTLQGSMRHFAETSEALATAGVHEATIAVMTVSFLTTYAALTYEVQHLR